MWKWVNYFLVICIGIIVPASKFPCNWHSDILACLPVQHLCAKCSCPIGGWHCSKTSGISNLQENSFPEKSLLVHPPGWRSGKGSCWYACTCLSLTNEPDHLGGSAFSLTLTGAGSFMKNKLIMHTKLHLQETLRCILQSSKMIRFTFCSQDMCPLLIGASWTTSRSAQPVFCLPCCTITGAQAWAPGCQVHCSGQQPGGLKA